MKKLNIEEIQPNVTKRFKTRNPIIKMEVNSVSISERDQNLIITGDDIIAKLEQSIMYYKHNVLLEKAKNIKKVGGGIINITADEARTLKKIFKVEKVKHILGVPVRVVQNILPSATVSGGKDLEISVADFESESLYKSLVGCLSE